MHKTHSHSKEGKHSASLLCFCMGFLFVIFHSQAKQRRRDQNKGETKTKDQSKQRWDQTKGCLLGLWGWQEIRIPCATRHWNRSASHNNFFGSTRTFNFRRQAACWSFFPFSELENFLQFCLRTRKALNTELDNIHPEMGEQVIHFDTVRHLEW